VFYLLKTFLDYKLNKDDVINYLPVVNNMQAKWHQRRPSRSMMNWPTKTEGISVRASRAKLRNTLPARFTAFSYGRGPLFYN
jgi:hypothetical protein